MKILISQKENANRTDSAFISIIRLKKCQVGDCQHEKEEHNVIIPQLLAIALLEELTAFSRKKMMCRHFCSTENGLINNEFIFY